MAGGDTRVKAVEFQTDALPSPYSTPSLDRWVSSPLKWRGLLERSDSASMPATTNSKRSSSPIALPS